MASVKNEFDHSDEIDLLIKKHLREIDARLLTGIRLYQDLREADELLSKYEIEQSKYSPSGHDQNNDDSTVEEFDNGTFRP